MAVTGGGGLIDLRYQVVDPDKAAAVHDPKQPPGDRGPGDRDGARRAVMQHGHKGAMRRGRYLLRAARQPGGLVQQGEEVAIAMVDSRLEHVRVR